MPEFKVYLRTQMEVVVKIEADDEDAAADLAWPIAEAYTNTLNSRTGDQRIHDVNASFDGIGADEIEEVTDGD